MKLKEQKKFGVISLGCDKNRVDSEKCIAVLQNAGYMLTNDVREAQIVVINTCAFLQSAREESVETVIETAGYKSEKLEKIVNEGLRLALGTSSADKSLDIILEYIGKALDGERTYIFEHNENGYDDNTYEWVANGIQPEKDNLQNIPPEVCANWYRNFQEDKNIVIENLEDRPNSSRQKTSWQSQ